MSINMTVRLWAWGHFVRIRKSILNQLQSAEKVINNGIRLKYTLIDKESRDMQLGNCLIVLGEIKFRKYYINATIQFSNECEVTCVN